MTAENFLLLGRLGVAHRRFNEAAADDRGKREHCDTDFLHMNSFNEAAADDRGKRGVPGLPEGAAVGASMRPRPMTAENTPGTDGRDVAVRASMRPRPMTAENKSAFSSVPMRGAALQ